ncbi:MAG: putative efflux pump rane fusion protein [Rariglobus sp.]|jgi:HlyD family secretion protein|nr:putative efflux pump rane fusion protein [Rariglobus sp.]
MKRFSPVKVVALLPALLASLLLSSSGCRRSSNDHFQGYLEGDFVYVGAPLAGRLDRLSVTKGSRVEPHTPLFTLEHAAELAAQQRAADQLASAQARLADLRKGSRPSEIAALEARLTQLRAAAELSRVELTRQDDLLKNRVSTIAEHDRARFAHEGNLGAVAEIEAQLATAKLGARPDAIASAEAEAAAAAAAKVQADWSVTQKSQSAPRAALVFDTLYREGEFVAAGQPVVSLLPPENLKVRFFVSEEKFAAFRTGQSVHVFITGRDAPLEARISYLSPSPEYTPPVLYNRENRAKLVFLVEALFTGDTARDLHPGQPVDVAPAP